MFIKGKTMRAHNEENHPQNLEEKTSYDDSCARTSIIQGPVFPAGNEAHRMHVRQTTGLPSPESRQGRERERAWAREEAGPYCMAPLLMKLRLLGLLTKQNVWHRHQARARRDRPLASGRQSHTPPGPVGGPPSDAKLTAAGAGPRYEAIKTATMRKAACRCKMQY